MRRILALLLLCAMILGLMPTAFATEKKDAPLTEADYVTADLMWEAVREKEALLSSKRAPLSETVEALIQEVTSSPYYEEDSLIRKGDHFFWKTTDGIACGYSPRLAQIGMDAKPLEGYDADTAQSTITSSYEHRSGTPGSADVYLFQPYYGLDSSFTTQYVTEANNIAQALGGKSTVCRTNDATIDAIADAIEAGAVVIFDSHGDTDYINGDDYATRANTSYICLQTGNGLTSKDYESATGKFGTYYHAYYAGSYGSMKYYCVDGTAIANHMEKTAPNSMLWMALCLSMTTDGLHAPLRSKGVEVAYGYSQSVTFDYDYAWEECFWKEMILGKTVAEAIATMKEEVGLWDWCHASDYDSIEEAREMFSAFPIAVSSEDVYPGHGKVDDLQTVHSTWTLLSDCGHTELSAVAAVAASCEEGGSLSYYQCNRCGALFSDSQGKNRITSADVVVPALGHDYDEGTVTTAPTCAQNGILTHCCSRCDACYTEEILALGHEYENGICLNCGESKPTATDFAIGVSGSFILAANVKGAYHAMPNALTTSSKKYQGVPVEVTEGYVHEDFAKDLVFTLTYHPAEGKYTIDSNGLYLKYPSSTNLSASQTPYYWTVSPGTNGSWRIVAATTSRGLVYRAMGYNSFGGYYLPNVTAGGSEYFDIEIIPVGKVGSNPDCPHDNVNDTITAPTCTAMGSRVIVCADCNLLLVNEVLPATGHFWGQVDVISEASCTTIGEIRYTCTNANCGESYSSTTPAYGHGWGEGKVTVIPTCVSVGIKTFTCSLCQQTKEEEIPATGHAWDEGTETLAPTCTEKGILTYLCTVCGEREDKSIPALGHDFSDGECIHCGIAGEECYVPFAPGVSGEYVIAAKVDGEYYFMKNSYPSSGKVSSDPFTLTEEYVDRNAVMDYVLTLSYHSEKGRYTIYNGVQYLKYGSGTNIGSSTAEYYWSIEEGVNGSWRITSASPDRALIFRAGAYQQFGGYSTSNVTVDSMEYFDVELIPVSRFIPEEGQDPTVAPDPTEDPQPTEAPIPGDAPETDTPDWENITIGHTLNLASDISINYAVKASALEGYDSFYMQCILPQYEGNTELETTTVYLEGVKNGSYYYFTLQGLTAVQMGNEIHASLKLVKDGQTYSSPTDSYSVASYAYSQLGKSNASQSLKKLCAQLLRYGALAQTYKAYRTDALVDAAMTADQLALLTDPETVVFGQNNRVLEDMADPKVTWAGKALSLESKVVVKFIVDLSAYQEEMEGLSLHIKYTDYSGKEVNLELNRYSVYDSEKNYYAFELDQLLAADLRSVISAVVYEGEDAVSATLEYSPDSYGNGKKGDLLALCRALVAYSDAALAYFTAP